LHAHRRRAWQSRLYEAPDCHCEASAEQKPWQSFLRLLRRFAPRNDNEEDRELEGVSNVMELYIPLTFPLTFGYYLFRYDREIYPPPNG
jgi:hypothetical protein